MENSSKEHAFVAAGTLTPPGPLGRALRFLLGTLCFYALITVLSSSHVLVAQPFSSLDSIAFLLIGPLCVFNYVVNIGFTRNWGPLPLVVTLGVLFAAAGIAWITSGTADSPLLGIPLTVWLAYFYGHLAVSFVTAALIATPGCEMRSIPELLGRLTGSRSVEHQCPVAFISRVDEWEQKRARHS